MPPLPMPWRQCVFGRGRRSIYTHTHADACVCVCVWYSCRVGKHAREKEREREKSHGLEGEKGGKVTAGHVLNCSGSIRTTPTPLWQQQLPVHAIDSVVTHTYVRHPLLYYLLNLPPARPSVSFDTPITHWCRVTGRNGLSPPPTEP